MSGNPGGLDRALALAHAYLNRRERTVSEIRRRLEREGHAGESVEQVLAMLADDGYVDDARFARLYVEDKRQLDQWGTERIRRGLLERGVEHELIDDALEREEESELDRAVALLTRRFPAPPRDRRGRDRALGVLVRKGYDPELALDALTAYARGG